MKLLIHTSCNVMHQLNTNITVYLLDDKNLLPSKEKGGVPVNLVLFELQVGHCNELIQLELCLDNLSLAWRVRPSFLLPAVDPHRSVNNQNEKQCQEK